MDLLSEIWVGILSTIFASITITLFYKLRKKIKGYLLSLFLPDVKRIGLTNIYKSWIDAKESIIEATEETNEIMFLCNKGTEWIGNDDALLSEAISKKSLNGIKIKVLLLNSDAPWLNTENWRIEHGIPSEDYTRKIFNNAHESIENYLNLLKNLDYGNKLRFHRDNPCWRLIITSNRLFISSYAHVGQAREASVLEFTGSDTPFFKSFKRYFDFLWERRSNGANTLIEASLSESSFDEFEQSSGALIYKVRNNEIKFAILKRKDGLITLPKGHVKTGESLQETMLREVKEETSIENESINLKKELGWYPNPLTLPDGRKILKAVCYFLVEVTSDFEKVQPDTEHKSVEWLSYEEILTLDVAYEHTQIVIEKGLNEIINSQSENLIQKNFPPPSNLISKE